MRQGRLSTRQRATPWAARHVNVAVVAVVVAAGCLITRAREPEADAASTANPTATMAAKATTITSSRSQTRRGMTVKRSV